VATTAIEAGKAWCHVDKIELQHSVIGGVHTFTNGDIRIMASRLKCDQRENVRAYLKAMVGDAHAGCSNVNLTEQESREKFHFYARQKQPDIDWLECVTQVNDILLGWLDTHNRAPGEAV
jgi:hypothetical protein